MATSGDLSRVIAKNFNLPEVTVANCYRALREANMVPKAGRGPRSSAPVTSETAAKLLIALCGSRHEKEPAPKVLESFNGLVSHWAEFRDNSMHEYRECDPVFRLPDYSFPCLEALGPRHSFLAGLTAIVDTAARGEFPFEQRGALRIPNRVTISVEISAAPVRRAVIGIMIANGQLGGYASANVEYHHIDDEKRDREELLAFLVNADLSTTRKFRSPTIIDLGELLGEEKGAGSKTSVQHAVDKIDALVSAADAQAKKLLEAGSELEKQAFRLELKAMMESLNELQKGLGDD